MKCYLRKPFNLHEWRPKIYCYHSNPLPAAPGEQVEPAPALFVNALQTVSQSFPPDALITHFLVPEVFVHGTIGHEFVGSRVGLADGALVFGTLGTHVGLVDGNLVGGKFGTRVGLVDGALVTGTLGTEVERIVGL